MAEFVTKEEVRTIVENIMQRIQVLDSVIYNHGNGLMVNYAKAKDSLERIENQLGDLSEKIGGLQTRVQGEDAVLAAEERAAKVRDKQMGRRIAILTVVIAILGFLLALFAFIEGKKTAKLLWPKDTTTNAQSVYADYAGPRAPY